MTYNISVVFVPQLILLFLILHSCYLVALSVILFAEPSFILIFFAYGNSMPNQRGCFLH